MSQQHIPPETAQQLLMLLRELTVICCELASELRPLEMATVRQARDLIAKLDAQP